MGDIADVPVLLQNTWGEGGSRRDRKTVESRWFLWSVLGTWGLTVDSSHFFVGKKFHNKTRRERKTLIVKA